MVAQEGRAAQSAVEGCRQVGACGANHPAQPRGITLPRPLRPTCAGLQAANYELQAASDPALSGVSGAYFVGGRQTRAPAVAYDAAAQQRLWRLLEEQTGARWSV